MKARRFLLSFTEEIDSAELVSCVSHLDLEPPVVTIADTVQIEPDGSSICLRKSSPEEENLRRIIRSEIAHLGRYP